jgi:D-tagatose-1,6-bisphosphate aldolase subunit GatZ/KbaZ
LNAHPAPVSLLSQYLPNQSAALRARVISNHPVELIHSKIMEVLDQYAYACGKIPRFEPEAWVQRRD